MQESNDQQAFNSVERIIEKLSSKDQEARREIILYLINNEFYSEKIISSLFKIINDADENIELRKKAVEALGNDKYKRSVKFLLNLANVAEEPLRISTFRAFKKLNIKQPDIFIELLNSHYSDVRANASYMLTQYKDTIAIQSLARVFISDENPFVRLQAAKALVAFGKQAQYYFIQALANENVEVRRLAIQSLGQIGISNDNVETIIPLVNDTDKKVQQTALKTLGVIKSKEAFDILLSIFLDKNQSNILRKSAVESLGEYEKDKILPHLLNAVNLKHEDLLVKAAVIRVLGDYKDESTSELLINFLKSSDWNLITAAIDVLGKLKDEQAVAPLTELVEKSQDTEIQFKALRAIKEIQDKKL